jgi:hypothetical protein
MNTKVVKKFLYAPALFTALALIATSECLAIGAEEHTEQLTRRVTVFRETQKIKDGPVMAEYQIAVAKGEMALTTMIVKRYSLRPAAGPGRRLPRYLLERWPRLWVEAGRKRRHLLPVRRNPNGKLLVLLD